MKNGTNFTYFVQGGDFLILFKKMRILRLKSGLSLWQLLRIFSVVSIFVEKIYVKFHKINVK